MSGWVAALCGAFVGGVLYTIMSASDSTIMTPGGILSVAVVGSMAWLLIWRIMPE